MPSERVTFGLGPQGREEQDVSDLEPGIAGARALGQVTEVEIVWAVLSDHSTVQLEILKCKQTPVPSSNFHHFYHHHHPS